MRKYILISVLLVCIYGCGKENPGDRVKDLENENKNLELKLQELSTEKKASSDVIKDVSTLIMNIQETENMLDEKKHRLHSAEEVNADDVKAEILKSIQTLYDNLDKYRKKSVELQTKLDSFIASDTEHNEEMSSLNNVIRRKVIKIERMVRQVDTLKKHVTHLEDKQEELTNKIGNLKSELDVKENEVSTKELEIKNLHQEINTIFYVIGSSKELRSKKIIVKQGVPLIRSLNPFSKNFVLGPDFAMAGFTQDESTLTKFRIEGKIKKILPYRNKNLYEITYEEGLSLINIKDSKSFWYQKYLVVVTK